MKSSKGRNEIKNLEGGLEATSLEKEEEGSNERDEEREKEEGEEKKPECKAAGGKHARRKFKFK